MRCGWRCWRRCFRTDAYSRQRFCANSGGLHPAILPEPYATVRTRLVPRAASRGDTACNRWAQRVARDRLQRRGQAGLAAGALQDQRVGQAVVLQHVADRAAVIELLELGSSFGSMSSFSQAEQYTLAPRRLPAFVAGIPMSFARPSGRTADQLRTVSITRGFTRHAEGRCWWRSATPACCARPASRTRRPASCAARARAGSPPSTACSRAPPTPATTARPGRQDLLQRFSSWISPQPPRSFTSSARA